MVFLPVMLSWIGPPPYLSALIRDKVGPFDDKEVLKRNDSAHNNPAFVSPKDEESMVNNLPKSAATRSGAQPSPLPQMTPHPLPRHSLIWHPHKNDFVIVSPLWQSQSPHNNFY